MNSAIQPQQLICHPDSRCQYLSAVNVKAQRSSAEQLHLEYALTGELSAIRIAGMSSAGRRDELWKHTCAEAFITTMDDDAYCELNFAPSTEWAAYEFTCYRHGMQVLACTSPRIHVDQSAQWLLIDVTFELPQRFIAVAQLQIGLCMVIEDHAGQCSYWALRHDAERADFHRRDTMILIV